LDSDTKRFISDSLVFTAITEHGYDVTPDMVCDTCGRPNLELKCAHFTGISSVINKVSSPKKEVSDGQVLAMCRNCFLETRPRDGKSLWPLGFSLEEDWDEVPESSVSLLDSIKSKYPEFSDALELFSGGAFTFDDGSEDSFLTSVADQVIKDLKSPSVKQRETFIRATKNLKKRKTKEGRLHKETTQEFEDRGKNSALLLKIARDNLKRFTPRTHKLINSFQDYATKKGSLTQKQLSWLHKIIEELPESILKKYMEDK
tara:strand:- start:1384 stop:2160 length:777 start_codon:yes stop_codon:yes gene_type:complete